MSPARLDILTEALTAIARLIMAARSDRDAEAIVHQLRALGPAQRADVDAVERARLDEIARERQGARDVADVRRRLRQDEPTQTSPAEKRHTLVQHGPLERPRIAPDFPGDLDGGE